MHQGKRGLPAPHKTPGTNGTGEGEGTRLQRCPRAAQNTIICTKQVTPPLQSIPQPELPGPRILLGTAPGAAGPPVHPGNRPRGPVAPGRSESCSDPWKRLRVTSGTSLTWDEIVNYGQNE